MMCEERTILVAEPDLAIRTLVVALLHRDGYGVQAAADAAAALQMHRTSKPAAIVIEPRMRGGNMVLAALRANPEIATKIIIITTPDWREPEYRSSDVAHAILLKPFFLHELTLMVASCFSAEPLVSPVGDGRAVNDDRPRHVPMMARQSPR